MEVPTACKLPYLFYKTMTKTNTKKGKSVLEVSMRDSRVCWEVGVRRELELVMKREAEGLEKTWTVTWRSGRKKQRGDRILGCWCLIAQHYKLAPKDVLAFTIISPVLISVLIINRHLHPSSRLPLLVQVPPLSKTPKTAQLVQGCKNLLIEAGSNPPNRELVCSLPTLLSTKPGASEVSGRTLWYVTIKAEHLEEGLLLLDIPPKFAREMAKGCWNGNRKAALKGEAQQSDPPLTQKLVLDHHEIGDGDLCVFELITRDTTSEVAAIDPSCPVLQVYVYKKDRGMPSIFTITFTP